MIPVVSSIQAFLRRILDVPSWDEVELTLDLFRMEQQNLLNQREARLTLNLNNRIQGRQDMLDEQEKRIDKQYAELDHAASITTLAVSDLMAAVQLARKDWQEVLKEQGHTDA